MTELDELPTVETSDAPADQEVLDFPPESNIEALPSADEPQYPDATIYGDQTQGEQDAQAAITADPQDLYRYQLARIKGASHQEALKVGDHGIGTWGDNLASYTTPMVELPADTPGIEPGRLVKVDGPIGSVVAKVAGLMPETGKLEGNADIHLNPAAALAVGHDGGIKPLKWSWATDQGSAKQNTTLAELPKPMSSKKSLGYLEADPNGKIEGSNPDGTIKWSDGWNIDPKSRFAYKDVGDQRITRFPDGTFHSAARKSEKTEVKADAEGKLFSVDPKSGESKEITPPGFATKTKIFKDTTTGLAFDISNPQSPKPLNLPGNPASVDLSGVKQGDWSSVPEDLRDVAQNIAQYKYPPISGFALRSPYFQQMFKIVSKVDPSFNYQEYPARQKFLTDFSSGSGKIGQNRLSFNTALDHINTALDSSEELRKVYDSDQFSNAVVLRGKQIGGSSTALNKYESDANEVGKELARAFTGAAPGLAEIQKESSDLVGGRITILSAKQRETAMKEKAKLLGSRLGEMSRMYESTMGKPLDKALVSPEAETTLRRLNLNDLVDKYGSRGGKRPYLDPQVSEHTVSPFPGSDKDVGATEHEVVEDQDGKRFVVSPDGKLIPYGQ